MAERREQKLSRVEDDRPIYEAIKSFIENPKFSSGAIETEHFTSKERLDGVGRIRLVRIVVVTQAGIDPALDTMMVGSPDCDDPCKKLAAFFKAMSHDFSFM